MPSPGIRAQVFGVLAQWTWWNILIKVKSSHILNENYVDGSVADVMERFMSSDAAQWHCKLHERGISVTPSTHIRAGAI